MQIYLWKKNIPCSNSALETFLPTKFTLIEFSFLKSSLISFSVSNALCSILIGDDQWHVAPLHVGLLSFIDSTIGRRKYCYTKRHPQFPEDVALNPHLLLSGATGGANVCSL